MLLTITDPLVAVSYVSSLVTFDFIRIFISACFSFVQPLIPKNLPNAYASLQSTSFIGHFISTVCSLVLGIIFSCASLILYLVSNIIWIILLMAIACICFLVFDYCCPWIPLELIYFYNQYFSPFLYDTIIPALAILDMVFSAVVPIFNAVFFFVSSLLKMLMLDAVASMATIVAIAESFSHSCISLISAMIPWIYQLFAECPQSLHDDCYSMQPLQLQTAASHFQRGLANIFLLNTRFCSLLAVPASIVSYPLFDANMQDAVHYAANAVLELFLHLPRITTLRCTRSGFEDPLLCIPDIGPNFGYVIQTILSLGKVVDAWLDFAYITVKRTLFLNVEATRLPDQCLFPFQASMLIPSIEGSLLSPVSFVTNSIASFSSPNASYFVVGLPSVNAFAMTDDASLAIYKSGVVSALTWNQTINASLGIAEISVGSPSTTYLMGCSCSGRAVVKCSVIPLRAGQEIDTPSTFVVTSPSPATQCLELEIQVKSVRWNSVADATIFIMPAYGSSNILYDACSPFCIAARRRGSAPGPLVAYDAVQWRESVFVSGRNCQGADDIADLSGQSVVENTVSSYKSLLCEQNFATLSRVSKSSHPAYEAPSQRYLRDLSSPFAFTGESVLTLVSHADGTYGTRVETLIGKSENSELTLSIYTMSLPSYPPPSVPSAITSKFPRDHLTIPYGRQPTLSAASRQFIFYAVNPAIEVFDAYLTYCDSHTPANQLPKFGIIVLSSYGPIRIWRVDAYRRCGVTGCGPNIVSQVDIPDAFSNGTFEGTDLSSECNRNYTEAIEQLEYVNELNIAVTIRRTNLKRTFLRRDTLWLHVENMQLASLPWQRSAFNDFVVDPPSGQTFQCPARSLSMVPAFGTMSANVVNVLVYLVKFAIEVVLYTPGIIADWSTGRGCPLVTHRHTALEKCGAEMFLLEDVFTSFDNANGIFWASISTMVSNLINTAGVRDTQTAENIIEGLSRFGHGSVDLFASQFIVAAFGKGTESAANALPTFAQMSSAGLAIAGARVNSHTLAWARFGYRLVVKMSVSLAVLVLNQAATNLGSGENSGVVSLAWQKLVHIIDEMREDLRLGVSANMREACAGLYLLFGAGNPWSSFVYHQCLAYPASLDSGFDLFLSVFSAVPMASCMCKGAAGKSFGDYAMQVCFPAAALSQKPSVLKLLSTASVSSMSLCDQSVLYARKTLESSLQPWFDAQIASADSLGGSVDYVLAAFDRNAGQCLNVDKDPDVVVIVPFPSDYFQACGLTSLCRAKCASTFDAFDTALQDYISYTASQSTFGNRLYVERTVNIKAESMFFPGLQSMASGKGSVVAPFYTRASAQLTSLAACTSICGHSGEPCLATGGIHMASNVLRVAYYCIPRVITSGVFSSVDKEIYFQWDAPLSAAIVTAGIADMQFGDVVEGSQLVVLTDDGKLYIVSRRASVMVSGLENHTDFTLGDGFRAVRVNQIQVFQRPPSYICIHAAVLYRQNTGTVPVATESAASGIIGTIIHRKITFDSSNFPDSVTSLGWFTLGSDNFFTKGYYASVITTSNMFNPTAMAIMLPAGLRNAPMFIWTLTWDASDYRMGVVYWEFTQIAASISDENTVAQLLTWRVSSTCVTDDEGAQVAFLTAPDNQPVSWLSQIRVSGISTSGSASARTFSSQSTGLSLQIADQCTLSTCSICPDGEVQSLCDAAQHCAVINCIGTPVNMRRTLCQVGDYLADEYRSSIAATHGMWVIFVEMFMVFMGLATNGIAGASTASTGRPSTGISAVWTDEVFFGEICTLKDRKAHFVSIFTSAINSVVQVGHSSLPFLQQGAYNVDSNFNAMSTMSMTALTSFLFHASLFPVYPLIVFHKTFSCNVNGVLAMFDATGTTIRIGSAALQSATDAAVGMCISQNAIAVSSDPVTSSSASEAASGLAASIIPLLSIRNVALEKIVHFIDAFISFLMGVVYGLSDLAASMDTSHCKLPDYSLNETMTCACQDTQFSIPVVRQKEQLYDFGLWCTGTLQMFDGSNEPFVIYNPFSFYEILSMMGRKGDQYMACMSSPLSQRAHGCENLLPSAPILDAQDVNLILVATACRRNYMLSRWDPAAYVIFNKTLALQTLHGVSSGQIPDMEKDPQITSNAIKSALAACLRVSRAGAECLNEYISSGVTGTWDSRDYWRYEQSASTTSIFADACQVFTGPAKLTAVARNSDFRACLDYYDDMGCSLPSNLWTPRSENVVPIAHMHSAGLSDSSTVELVVQIKLQKAHDLVMKALSRVADYNNPELLTIFFSPEGDVMHQMMDCVFMGPYSKVDYWPRDSKGQLPVPAWYRDLNGTSRSIDPHACVSQSIDKSPPFSCGSSARQSLIKYFFRDFLPREQNATMRSLVAFLSRDLHAAWDDMSQYTCNSSNCSNFLPQQLQVEYGIISANPILRTLTSQVEAFYRYAMEEPSVWTKYMDDATKQSYLWSKQENFRTLALKEALFKTTVPILTYQDASEINDPLQFVDNTKPNGLWHQCHGLLSQVFFTIPLRLSTDDDGVSDTFSSWLPDVDKQLDEYVDDDGLFGAEQFIQAVVSQAEKRSPLYRHYNVSYVPSDSRMCKNFELRNRQKSSTTTSLSNRYVRTTNIKIGEVLIFNSSAATLFPEISQTFSAPIATALGVGASSIAGCFCGWPRSTVNFALCIPPETLCAGLNNSLLYWKSLLCPSYVHDKIPTEMFDEFVRASWSPIFTNGNYKLKFCPAMSLSDGWGIIDSTETNDWLTGINRDYAASGISILRYGRAGLKAGNIATLPTTFFLSASPLHRVSSSIISKSTLTVCEPDISSILSDAKKFVRGLIPAAQGIFEQGSSVYCLRFMIEYAVWYVLNLQFNNNQDSGYVPPEFLARQKQSSDSWKLKCESQLSLLGLCQNLDVFRVPVNIKNRFYDCPFSIDARSDNDIYMTPGCLVHRQGTFYDPCNGCSNFSCVTGTRPIFTVFTEKCSLKFNPLVPNSIIVSSPLQGRWRVEDVMSESFVYSILSTPGIVGNLADSELNSGKTWKTSEGRLNTTGQNCDMLADWWPENQTIPVGYHATVSCKADDTGYRTFDTAFAVQRLKDQNSFTIVRLTYQHDITRNASLVDTHFGAGGLCRWGTIGMPLYRTNTMTLCTRELVGSLADDKDMAIPVGAQIYGESAFSPEERCSPDSVTGIPWTAGNSQRHDASLFSLGTVPNMPPNNEMSDVSYMYPSSSYDSVFAIGSSYTTFSDGCGQYNLEHCMSSADCPRSFQCVSSVCVHGDLVSGVRCLRHDSCPDNMLCDGTGTCVKGSILFNNSDDSSDMELTAYAEKCDDFSSLSFDTIGISPWENVPDWLTGHGMCSNKNWYAYRVNMRTAATCDGTVCTSTFCSIDPAKCKIGMTSKALLVNASSFWWTDSSPSPEKFAVNPTLCDRDYEHMSNMKGCAPKDTLPSNRYIDEFGAVSRQSLQYARMFQNYRVNRVTGQKSTVFARMPFESWNRSGFLGVDQSRLAAGPTSSYIINCERFQNCYNFPFTFNGKAIDSRRLIDKNMRDDSDTFRCGIFAYYNPNLRKCKLDRQVAGLYVALCETASISDVCTCSVRSFDSSNVQCQPTVNKAKLLSVCGGVQTDFYPSYQVIAEINANLQALFSSVFLMWDGSLNMHVSAIECFNAIYQKTSSLNKTYSLGPHTGIYIPFMFAMYEIPFSWLYQCIHVQGMDTSIVIQSFYSSSSSAASVGGMGSQYSASSGSSYSTSSEVSCSAFSTSISIADTQFLDPGQMFPFRRLRAGYSWQTIKWAVQNVTNMIGQSLPFFYDVPEIRSKCTEMQLTSSQCRMVPFCATVVSWLSIDKMNGSPQDMLNALYHDPCSSTNKMFILGSMQMTFKEFIDTFTAKSNFQPDTYFSETKQPSVREIILRLLEQCIAVDFNPSAQQSISVTFPRNAIDLRVCFTNNNAYSKTFNWVERSMTTAFYKNPDVAYKPTDNIAEIRLTDVENVDEAKACIYYDSVRQLAYYNYSILSDTSAVTCVFRNFKCNGMKCNDYPLVYGRGQNDCQYPLNSEYSSLIQLIQQTLELLEPILYSNFQNAFASFPGVQLDPLLFLSEPESFFNQHSFFRFNVLDIRRYLGNINPDTSKQLMCQLSTATVNFTSCNDQNFLFISDFTDSLRQDGPIIVPSGYTLEWQISRDFLNSGSVFSFASTDRKQEQVFLRNVMDKSTRCGQGEQMYNRVCLMKTSGAVAEEVRPWVPWMSGDWNPYEMCDVRQSDLSQGNQEIIWPYDIVSCPDCQGVDSEFRTSYMLDLQIPTCTSRQNTFARAVNVEPTAPTNICRVAMQNKDNICTHKQGMLGGNRGRSVLNHPVNPNLYAVNNVSTQFSRQGIFPRVTGVGLARNLLLAGGISSKEDEYGFVRVPGDEIGVSEIRMSLDVSSDNIVPVMRVQSLPLQRSFASSVVGFDSPSITWARDLQNSMYNEHTIITHSFQTRDPVSARDWNCPYQRLAFYGGTSASFSPLIPDPRRAKLLFGHLTANQLTHPTQPPLPTSSLGEYVTTNGACFCPKLGLDGICQIPLGDTTHPCSFYNTVQALQGKKWIKSHVFIASPQCTMQFDWPYLDGRLRDGSNMKGQYETGASDQVNRKCHILDRSRPFMYSYKAQGNVQREPTSTLDTGGVCHSGRAARLESVDQAATLTATRCVKVSESKNQINVQCEDGTQATLAKEKSTPTDSLIQLAKSTRTRCSQCSATPSFFNARNEPIAAESSFGIPFRFSSSRAISVDLRERLMREVDNISWILNETAWVSEVFIDNLLSNPSLLLNFSTQRDSTLQNYTLPWMSPPSLKGKVDVAWESEWVFCNSTDALKTNQCVGKISEQDFRANRFESCHRSIRYLTRNDPDTMSTVDVCLMDSNLASLCSAVQQAQKLVREANCILNGSCLIRPFLYLPSIWDTSNKDFVHRSVKQFYRAVSEGSCPMSEREETIVQQNRQILNNCMASPLISLYVALQACRNIVDTLAQILFYIFNIITSCLVSIFTGDLSGAKSQVVFYWTRIVELSRTMISVLSDVFFDMLFHMGTLGAKIHHMLLQACSAINTAYRYWLNVWCAIAMDLAPMALDAIRKLAQYAEVAFQVLNDALDSIFITALPAALKAFQAMGYKTSFRDKYSSQQSVSKQKLADSVRKSKLEGKVVDQVVSKLSDAQDWEYGSKKEVKVIDPVYTRSKGKSSGAYMEKIGGAIGKIGVAASALSIVMDIGQAAFDDQDFAEMMGLYPSNWTLFDFSTIFIVLDTIAYYVSNEDTCLAHRAAVNNSAKSSDVTVLDCSIPSLADSDSFQGAFLAPTRCWADASRQVGSSLNLACSPSDSCQASEWDLSTIVCGSCPQVSDEGYATYGCSSTTQTCVCRVRSSNPTGCTSHEQCYTSRSTCRLLTGLDEKETSYGNMPCFQCTKQTLCIISDGTSGVGECSCVYQTRPMQECSEPGAVVSLSGADRYCGYIAETQMIGAFDSYVSNDISQFAKASASAIAYWDSMSLTRCLNLRQSNSYCLRVFRPSGGSFMLVVGLGSSSSISPFRAGRRLLSDNDWNINISKNITMQVPEGQPIDAVSQSADAISTILSENSEILEEILKSPVYVLGKFIEELSWVNHTIVLAQKFKNILAKQHLKNAVRSGVRVFHVLAQRNVSNLLTSRNPFLRVKGSRFHVKQLPYKLVPSTKNTTNNLKGRHLLQQSLSDSAWISGNVPLSSRSPVNTKCAIGLWSVEIAYEIVTTLAVYYSGREVVVSSPLIKTPEPSFVGNNQGSKARVQATDSTTSFIFVSILNGFGVRREAAMSAGSVQGIASNIYTIAAGLLRCDFRSTFAACRDSESNSRNLLLSLAWWLLVNMAVWYISSVFHVQFAGFLISLLFTPLFIYFAYGMSPVCSPMLPTCLVSDISRAVKNTFPIFIDLPSGLKRTESCATNHSSAFSSDCLISCQDEPMGFVGWQDTMAFGICRISASACQSCIRIFGTSPDSFGGKCLRRKTDKTSESDLCFFISIAQFLPVVILIVLYVIVSSVFSYVPLVIFPSVVNLAMRAVSYIHRR